MQSIPARPYKSRLSSFGRGARLAIPITLGYVPVGFTFGVLAEKAGFSALEAGLTGLLVFAGSGQLIAINLILLGLSPLTIISTTFIVNARHMLMSAAMVPYLGRWSKLKQFLYAAQMTDETFALNIGRFGEQVTAGGPGSQVDEAEAFGINLTSHFAWVLGGVLGALFGSLISDLKPYGLDFALAGMFIALLLPHLKIPRHLATTLVAGGLSIVLSLAGVAQWNVIIATVCAATFCLLLPFPHEKKEQQP